MLIHNYEPLGSSYITRMGYDGKQSLSSFNSEHPVNHQGERHPRSVVALTADNRLLLFTVDGRTNYSSGTNVVNYPTDNGGHDHFGQRTVPTHFTIIDTEK